MRGQSVAVASTSLFLSAALSSHAFALPGSWLRHGGRPLPMATTVPRASLSADDPKMTQWYMAVAPPPNTTTAAASPPPPNEAAARQVAAAAAGPGAASSLRASSDVNFVAECMLPTLRGTFRARAYRCASSSMEPVALVAGDLTPGAKVYVAIRVSRGVLLLLLLLLQRSTPRAAPAPAPAALLPLLRPPRAAPTAHHHHHHHHTVTVSN